MCGNESNFEFVMEKGFSSLGLGNWLVNQVSAVGYKCPTAVQENCIPPILAGKCLNSSRLLGRSLVIGCHIDLHF